MYARLNRIFLLYMIGSQAFLLHLLSKYVDTKIEALYRGGSSHSIGRIMKVSQRFFVVFNSILRFEPSFVIVKG